MVSRLGSLQVTLLARQVAQIIQSQRHPFFIFHILIGEDRLFQDFFGFPQVTLGEVQASDVAQSGSNPIRIADFAEFLDGLTPHPLRLGQIALLVIEAGDIGHHHRFTVKVSGGDGALQRDLTFAHGISGRTDRRILLAKNAVRPGDQNVRSLRAGFIDRALRRGPGLREIRIDQC